MISTITSIAEQAGVSIATVSRVLNESPRVCPKTRKRVAAILRHSNYTPRIMRSRAVHLGLVQIESTPVVEAYQAQIISGILSYTSSVGLSFSMLHMNPFNPRGDILKDLRERGCDAGLLISQTFRLKKEVFEGTLPCLALNERVDLPNANVVVIDQTKASKDLMEYLLNLGHRHIAYVGRNPGHATDDREAAFREVLERYRLSPKGLLVLNNPDGPRAEENGLELGKTILRDHPHVTAIIAYSDEIAYGVYRAAMDAGVDIPGRISLVGYDDFVFSQILEPRLTVVRQPHFAMGREAARLAHQLAQGNLEAPLSKVLPAELIVRDSTGSPYTS
jgi:DNA-binding LacI/PurR family transcriptional regulator